MSVNVTVQASKSAFLDSARKNTNLSSDEINRAWRASDRVCIGFGNVQNAYKYREVEDILIYVYSKNTYTRTVEGISIQDYPTGLWLHPFTEDWNESEITYNNAPTVYKYIPSQPDYIPPSFQFEEYIVAQEEKYVEYNIHRYMDDAAASIFVYPLMKNALKNGVVTGVWTWKWSGEDRYNTIWGDNLEVYTTRSEHPPYAILKLSDNNVPITISSVSPASGYIPKHLANVFSWSISQDKLTPADLTVSSAKIQWKSTQSGTVHEINCGAVSNYIVPANTFSTNDVYWRVSITDSGGSVVNSEWCLLSTQESLSSAEAIYPKNINVDGSVPNTFEWSHIISTSTNSTRSELQYSQNRITWSSLATVTGSSLSAVIPENTLPSGMIYWRVRTYNTDNAPGEWSESVVINSVSPPLTPSVTATQTPKPLIKWQSTYQQGFQIVIDDIYDSGIMYGEEKEFKLPVFLNDGSYSVKVKIVNSIGLWSDWGTAPINVQNSAGTQIQLSTNSLSGVVNMTWDEQQEYDGFIIYRDGIIIAKIGKVYSYADIFTSGEHIYQIRGIYNSSDNYGMSNISREDVNVNTTIIIDVETSEIIPLEYSTSALSETSITRSQSNSRFHIFGAIFPIIERSEYENKTFTFNTAFAHDSERISTFENLFGKIVCVKCKGREAVTGVLDVISKRISVFYINYSCTLTQIQYEEEIKI